MQVFLICAAVGFAPPDNDEIVHGIRIVKDPKWAAVQKWVFNAYGNQNRALREELKALNNEYDLVRRGKKRIKVPGKKRPTRRDMMQHVKQQVTAAEQERAKIGDEWPKPPMIAFKVGGFGYVPGDLEVLEVINESSALLYSRVPDFSITPAGTTGQVRYQSLPPRRSGPYWFTGLDTSKMTSGATFTLRGLFWIPKTQTYQSRSGARSVLVFEAANDVAPMIDVYQRQWNSISPHRPENQGSDDENDERERR